MEPARGRYNFSRYDRVVGAAARHGIEVLPIVMRTPRWASSRPRAPRSYLYAPRSSRTYANFLRTLIRRYGTEVAPSGAPRARRRSRSRAGRSGTSPRRTSSGPRVPGRASYTRMLKAAYRAAKRADRKATDRARQPCRRNGQHALGPDPGALQGRAPGSTLTRFRSTSSPRPPRCAARQADAGDRQARSGGRCGARRDRKKPIWFTELTWTAAQGQIPRGDLFGFETTPRGQAARLNGVFSRLARDRKRLGIGRVYWYNWASEYVPTYVPGGPGALTFQYSGLNKLTGTTSRRCRCSAPTPVWPPATRAAARATTLSAAAD